MCDSAPPYLQRSITARDEFKWAKARLGNFLALQPSRCMARILPGEWLHQLAHLTLARRLRVTTSSAFGAMGMPAQLTNLRIFGR
jgi:hypothetical protein